MKIKFRNLLYFLSFILIASFSQAQDKSKLNRRPAQTAPTAMAADPAKERLELSGEVMKILRLDALVDSAFESALQLNLKTAPLLKDPEARKQIIHNVKAKAQADVANRLSLEELRYLKTTFSGDTGKYVFDRYDIIKKLIDEQIGAGFNDLNTKLKVKPIPAKPGAPIPVGVKVPATATPPANAPVKK